MLKLFDSYQKKERPFRPLHNKGRVTIYGCGPTVYSDVHIGNLRTFVLYDLLKRFLEQVGFDVTLVMNITDVGHMLADADEGEDKMEVAAKESGQTPQEVAETYTRKFFRDVERLNFRRADVYPRASEHVPEMVAMVERLLERGHAYRVGHRDGGASVYFDVSTFKDYGHLSGNKIDDLDPGARIEVRKEKKHPADFALWIHNPRHLMQWESPWGAGYPGWHIECSAMATKYLGDTIDIHAGGEDNRFPHHECEIAQSEGSTGKNFVRYWLHVTHLKVEGQKMAKSAGNFYTLDDLLEKGHAARAVRYLLLSVHYRQPLNFTLRGLEGAAASLDRLDCFADTLSRQSPEEKGRKSNPASAAQKEFLAALEDDLNVAAALAVLFDYVRGANERIDGGELTRAELEAAQELLLVAGRVLGFTFGRTVEDEDVPSSVRELVERREQARADKSFAEADRIRGELLEKGYEIEDTAEGPIVKKK